MGVKYRLDFQNVEGYDCRVEFDFAGYSGDVLNLKGSTRPFVLGEFNSDNDIFKPVRPQQATIEIVTDGSDVTMEDFLSDNDDDITIRFDFGPWTGYWYGFMSQEDISESWIDQEHIITLRADEGIGRLQNIQLQSTAGQRLNGVFTPLNLIAYAADKSKYQSFRSHIISNLFYEGMTTTFTSTGLDQCYVDARTFEQSVNNFDDSYTVLQKVNTAWCQTTFQYDGEWWIVRIPEMFINPSQTLNVINNDRPTVGNRTSSQTRYDILVGVDEDVKPIMPEMLKSFRKPSKQTTIRFDWVQFDQVICNESFQDGTRTQDFTGGTGIEKYTVDDWTLQTTSVTTPVNSTALFERRVEYTNYKITDEYVYLGVETSPDRDNYIRSCNIYVTELDNIDIEFQFKAEATPGTQKNQALALVLLYAFDGTKYALASFTPGSIRKWVQWTNDAQLVYLYVPSTIPPTEWTTFKQTYDDNVGIANDPIPKSGYLNICLYRNFSAIGVGGMFFKDLKISIESYARRNRVRQIKGDYDRYTIQRDINKNYTETTYLDDAETHTYKGAIYKADGITLTGDRWFRRKNDTERFTFKRQNALAKWFMNRSYKTMLDVNLYGLTWENSGTKYPIGLINTIIFVDDAPTKVFGISNIKEIDFMNGTWSASLIEVFDTTVADNEPGVNDVHSFDFYYE
jgi:hypothetical protein